jgi:hypothetical protein
MGMQVPTGVGCFTGRSSVPDQVTGTCLEKSRSRLQSYLDYYIFPGEGNCQSIQDLLAKPLVAPSKSSPKAAIQSVSFKYQIDWLVDQPSPGAHTDQVNDVKVTLKDGLPANLCSTSISVLQQIGSCSLALTTGNALSSGFEICQNRMISVPLLWGLMRSINLEAPSAIDFVRDCPTKNTTYFIRKSKHQNESSTTYGFKESANLQKFASLSELQQRKNIALNIPASCIITGGTGSLGSLVANLLTNTSMIDDVRLAGRSGKVKSSVSLSILNSSKLVVLHMADFSVSEDSKIAEEKDLLRPFVHVIHAGGALQDGLIQTQSYEKIHNPLFADHHSDVSLP